MKAPGRGQAKEDRGATADWRRVHGMERVNPPLPPAPPACRGAPAATQMRPLPCTPSPCPQALYEGHHQGQDMNMPS